MKFVKTLLMLMLLAMTAGTGPGRAEDIDLFNNPPHASPVAPNIIFVIDNSANWSRASEAWGIGPDGKALMQGDAELQALSRLVDGLTTPANLGLVMFTQEMANKGDKGGGYVRFGLRDMTVPAHVTAWKDILGGIKTTAEQVNMNARIIPHAYYEIWQYLKGGNSWAGMDALSDFAGNGTPLTTAARGLANGFAYNRSTYSSGYTSPLGANCAKTYIIYISNTFNQNPAQAVSGTPALTTLAANGYSTAPDVQSAWARFLRLRPDLPAGSTESTMGQVITYTIDVYNTPDSANPAYSNMLMNMAAHGGGQYYQAKNTAALDLAFKNIMAQIQAVNSVFAAASLPVSVSVRGTHLNQVYLGVFRPDGSSRPNWAGNLKQYKLAVNTLSSPPSVYLADGAGKAAENPVTGFIDPSATSIWTVPSSFWSLSYYVNSQGVGGTSDAPDGDVVEKGGVAQSLRTDFATSQTGRKIYTCTGTCGTASTAFTTFDTGNNDISTSSLGAASTTERDKIINWVRGGNTKLDDPANAAAPTTDIRGFVHGDVLHSRPAVINYNRNSDDIVVFYGANDGMLHAVKGGQVAANGDGKELWGYIDPDHLPTLKRLYDHSPVIATATPKPYFVDGSPTVYTESDAAGVVTKALLFATMRRGGRFMYALDVTNPTSPSLLWKRKHTSPGFAELGETWSDPKIAKIRGRANPVLIFGLGNDGTANDPTIQGVATRGRGVMVVDATDGTPIWQSGPAPSGAASNKTVAGMTYAIPAPVTLYDSNRDGYIDRIYAADTGANVWRINIDDASPDNWTVSQIASLGGTGVNARKFLFAPDLIRATTTNNFDTLLIGSGDREHPFDTSIENRYYMIKDSHGLNATRVTPIVEGAVNASTGVSGQLFDVTNNLIQVGTDAQKTAAATALDNASGWYIRLLPGEKVVSGSTTLAGTVFFGTNRPIPVAANACTGNLGEARLYRLNYLNGASTFGITTEDRYITKPGGGFPPTPVPVSVKLGDNTYNVIVSGPQVITPPGVVLGRRYRTFWRKGID